MRSGITSKQFQKLFKKPKERTSSLPSGIHITHYIASEFSEDLSETISLAISLPFIHGFSLKRWQQSTHLMLEKMPGKPLLHKLRIIQLLEADYNIYLKIKIGCEFMIHVENNNLLGEEMHGEKRKNGP